jgi:hypothetical protein
MRVYQEIYWLRETAKMTSLVIRDILVLAMRLSSEWLSFEALFDVDLGLMTLKSYYDEINTECSWSFCTISSSHALFVAKLLVVVAFH